MMNKSFFKKNWSNILFFALILLLVFPQTRVPIQVFVQRLISFSPSETDIDEREILQDYNWNLLRLDFKDTIASNEEVNFGQSKDKVTIVNFWATWCPPCIAEMPSFQKLYNEYGDKVDFYFVTSEEAEKIGSFMNKNDYTLPIFRKIFDAPKELDMQVLPTTFLISKSGEIYINEEGAADWNSKKTKKLLDELLDE